MRAITQDKKLCKTETKTTTARKKVSTRMNEQTTTRPVKQSLKQKKTIQQPFVQKRSPQIIKLMINELQKQLVQKTENKKTYQNKELFDFKTTSKKIHSTTLKNTKTQQMNSCMLTASTTWKSPTKNKSSKGKISSMEINQSSTKRKQEILNLSQNKVQKKKQKKKVDINAKNKSHKVKEAKQNYVFFGNDLVQLSNTINEPLFVVENNDFLFQQHDQLSKKEVILPSSSARYNFVFHNIKGNDKTTMNTKNRIIIDEKGQFLRHSKVASFESGKTESSTHAKFIERTFSQLQQSLSKQQDYEEEQNIQLFSLDLFNSNHRKDSQISHSKIKEFEKQKQSTQQKKQFKAQKPHSQLDNIFDINKAIRLNNSVVRIQKWWREIKPVQRNQDKSQSQPIESSSNHNKNSLQTIQTKSQNSLQCINTSPSKKDTQRKNQLKQKKSNDLQDKNQFWPKVQIQSSSEKQIRLSTFEQPEHNDILKLRQNAAYLQFSTHQQILKELLQKNKITQNQFLEKHQEISSNLEIQLNDINTIKQILKDSALKVQNIMKKTRDDIKVVKQIVYQQEQQEKIQLNVLLKVSQKSTKENDLNLRNTAHVLETIFGKKSIHQTILPRLPTEQGHMQQFTTQSSVSFKKTQHKASCFQKEMQEFIDQNSQQDLQDSLISSSRQTKMFNSPNGSSQEDLNSPNSRTHSQQNQSEQQIEQNIFSSQIDQVPSGSSQASAAMPFSTANFEQLYKQYQQQQQTKKQIQTRIAKQLGVSSENDSLLIAKPAPQIGITTSIVGIHKFLLNFFKYYLYYHKNDFLTYMNMPYGQSIETRLSKNKLKQSQKALQQWTKTAFYTDDDEEIIYGLKNVIPESILEDFFESYYEETDIEFSQTQKTNIELEKIHNRAVFEAFNTGLNFFRPYYGIGGAPYLWCSSEKSLTFYCIGEQNIQEVYEKTQMKILKTSSYLCGVNIQVPHKKKISFEKVDQIKDSKNEFLTQVQSPFKLMENQVASNEDKSGRKVKNIEEFLECYTENFNAAYYVNLEDRLKKKQLAETEEENQEWFCNTFEEGKVATLLSLTQLIEEIILLEECSILQNIQTQRERRQLR